ncbi:MAG: alpha/beta hydrolase fold domain-containing protein, partial [Planctomycetales bacterium]|nr:alpha/beta hydrolase fold domain-containing protein [Planctomycetales bacterium]
GVLAVPAKAKSFKNLPRTLIITAQYDVLRDEGERFAEQLKEAGNDVTLRRYDGMIHGFLHFSNMFEQANVAMDDLATYLRTAYTTN